MSKQEDITIIGAGITGMMTALFLARVKNEDGTLKYKVTILEKNQLVAEGASRAFFRLHLGGEYPLDPETAEALPLAAVLWKLILGTKNNFFTDQGPMNITIAKATHEAGLRGEPGAITLEQYEEFYKNSPIKKYEEVIKEIINFCRIKDTPNARKELAEELFGQPEDMLSPISAEDLKKYYGDHNQGGFETREQGIALFKILSAIEEELKKNNVTILTGKHATRIEDTGNGYITHCADDSAYFSNQLTLAAWQGNFELDGPLRAAHQHKTATVYLRAMAEADTSGVPLRDQPPPTFGLKDDAGGMSSPYTKDITVFYDPKRATLAEFTLDSSDPAKRSVPVEWSNFLTKAQEDEILRLYQEDMKNGPYPYAAHAKFKSLIVRPTLNYQDSIDKRRHEPLEEIRPGFFVASATKGTFAMQLAVEMVQAIEQRSKSASKDLIPAPNSRDALYAVLSRPEFKLHDIDLTNRSLLASYLYRHELPSSIIDNPERTSHTPTTSELKQRHNEERLYMEAIGRKKKAGNRSFGMGFGPGHKVTVYEESNPKTGSVLDVNDAHNNAHLCANIIKWLASSEDRRPLTEVIPAYAVANALGNRLLHTDMLNLMETMSAVMVTLSEESVQLLFGREKVQNFPRDIWDRIRKQKPQLPNFREMVLKQRRSANSITLDEEVTALMLPSMFMQLTDAEKEFVACEIAELINKLSNDKKFFEKLSLEQVNIPVFQPAMPMLADSISNTGRAIKINFQYPANLEEKGQGIAFQGNIYYPVEFHFHRAQNIEFIDGKAITKHSVEDMEGNPDGMLEFAIYKNPRHEDKCTLGLEEDPNDNAVGELHVIYMHKDESGHCRALALCAHVKLGEENQGLAPIVAKLTEHNEALSTEYPIILQDTKWDPLACCNRGSFTDIESLPEAPFVSLALGGVESGADGTLKLKPDSSSTFYLGVSVIHLPDSASLTISPEQLLAFQLAQPQLEVMMPINYVEPIQLAAGIHKSA